MSLHENRKLGSKSLLFLASVYVLSEAFTLELVTLCTFMRPKLSNQKTNTPHQKRKICPMWPRWFRMNGLPGFDGTVLSCIVIDHKV